MVYLSLIVQELVHHAILSKHVDDKCYSAELECVLHMPLVVAELTDRAGYVDGDDLLSYGSLVQDRSHTSAVACMALR